MQISATLVFLHPTPRRSPMSRSGSMGKRPGVTSTYQQWERTTSVLKAEIPWANTAKVTLYASTLQPLEKVRAKDTKQIRGWEVSLRSSRWQDSSKPCDRGDYTSKYVKCTLKQNSDIQIIQRSVNTPSTYSRIFSVFIFSGNLYGKLYWATLPALLLDHLWVTGGTPTPQPTTEIPPLGVISGYLNPKQRL